MRELYITPHLIKFNYINFTSIAPNAILNSPTPPWSSRTPPPMAHHTWRTPGSTPHRGGRASHFPPSRLGSGIPRTSATLPRPCRSSCNPLPSLRGCYYTTLPDPRTYPPPTRPHTQPMSLSSRAYRIPTSGLHATIHRTYLHQRSGIFRIHASASLHWPSWLFPSISLHSGRRLSRTAHSIAHWLGSSRGIGANNPRRGRCYFRGILVG